MSDPAPDSPEFLLPLVAELVPPALREEILDEVARRAPRASRAPRDAIARLLRPVIPGGFRDPLNAPKALIKRHLDTFFGSRVWATEQILSIWVEAVSDLFPDLQEFIGTEGGDLLQQSPTTWSVAKMVELADRYVARHGHVERDKAAIAVACSLFNSYLESVFGSALEETFDAEVDASSNPEDQEAIPEDVPHPLDRLATEHHAQLESTLLRRLLHDIEQLPVDAIEWTELPAFVTLLARVRADWQIKLETANRLIFRQWQAIHDQYREELQYCECSEIRSLVDINPSMKVPLLLSKSLDALEALLKRLRDVRESQPQTARKDLEKARLAEETRLVFENLRDLLEGSGHKADSHPMDSAITAAQDERPFAPREKEKESVAATGSIAIVNPTETKVEPESTGTPPLENKQDSVRAIAVPEARPEAPVAVTARTGLPSANRTPAVLGANSVTDVGRGETAPPSVAIRGEVRRIVSEGIVTPDLSEFICNRMNDGDLAGAYWLAYSATDAGIQSIFPDWLLAAAQAGPWLTYDSDSFVQDLLEIASSRQLTTPAEHLLGLSVGLKAALVAPATGLASWLKPQEVRLAALHEVVEAVTQFATYNTALRPEDLSEVAGATEMEGAIRRAGQEAKQVLTDAVARITSMWRAHQVWLCFSREELPGLLAPVSRDQRSAVDLVRSSAQRWYDLKNVQAWINDTDARLSRRALSPIVGAPRDQILRRIRDCSTIAKRWCELVDRAVAAAAPADWFLERAKQLQSVLTGSIPRAHEELHELIYSPQPQAISVSARTLQLGLNHLAGMLRLPTVLGDAQMPAYEGRTLRVIDATPRLERALAVRLLWLPELNLDTDGRPREGTTPQIPNALRAATTESRTLLHAYRGWAAKHDFRFRERLSLALADYPDLPLTSEETANRFREARETLRTDLQRTRDMIEQAVVDGVISDERAELSESTELDITEVLEFAPRLTALAKVRARLQDLRQDRVDQVKARWEQLDAELSERFPGERWDRVRTFVTAVLQRGDPRLMYECVERLEEVSRAEADLPEAWIQEDTGRNVLADFLERIPLLEDSLHAGFVQTQKAIKAKRWLVRDLTTFPQPRLDEAQRALGDWAELKTGPWSASAISSRLEGILRFVGFTLSDDVNRLSIVAEGPDWAYVRAKMSASSLSPVPQFGSQARGLYDILCIRERPGMDLLGARLRDAQLEGQPVIVVYLARMPLGRRRELNRLTRRADLPIIALDELLLLFLAGERDARLPVFLRCALPYSSVNPYTPSQAGDVPPEMFYGRREMVRELERPEGACLVYGGRQLGKSVLLRRVERDLNAPDRGTYARMLDIKLIGDPQGDLVPAELWRRVRDAFKDFQLLPTRTTTDQPKEIIKHVREVLRKPDVKRVVLLFDEADAFLDADARAAFQVVTELRTLMSESNRRLKVVFAGLQNVQRFQGIANQPLAHFGRPLRVGPLESDAAERLIRKPFEALGYQFEDDSVVLRVLSYTNYHPGLIQLFCQQLLRAIRANAGTSLPPYIVRADDVEGVYRQPVVRDSIRERFEWTLALDPRYQCTAWALIVDQINERDGFARGYSPRQALELAKSWWANGFESVNLDRFRAILDEMVGLGVLVRTTEGHYRLRSPNLVRLIGREADIEESLMELADKPAVLIFDADSHRASLDTEARRYSPLTFADERRVLPPEFGVSLVFGSTALGVELLPEAIHRATAIPGVDRSSSPKWPDLGHLGADADAVRGALRRYLQTYQRYARLTAVEMVDRNIDSVAGRVDAAVRFCQEAGKRGGSQSLRVVFVFPPESAWYWLESTTAAVVNLEPRVDSVVSLTPWNLVGLRRRLEQQDKMATDDHCRRLLEVTGGWPALIDEVFERCGGNPDMRSAVDEVRADLEMDSPTRRRFIAQLGLGVVPGAHALIKFVNELGDVRPDDFLADIIGDPALTTDQQCARVASWLGHMSVLSFRDSHWTVDAVVARIVGAE